MFYVFPTAQDIARFVSAQMHQLIRTQQRLVLGLATGSTMKPVYAQFIDKYQEQNCSLEHVHCFNLDEYIGLPAEHPQTYAAYMQKHLYTHLPFVQNQLYLPCGEHWPSDAECLGFSEHIQALGGIDLQLLGIGTNGHIGFNEPGTSFDQRTHVVALSEQTRRDNSRFFNNKDEMPTHAVTLGLKDIIEAKKIFLLATGEQKAQIMGALQRSDITEHLPASILKKHADVAILVDEAAAQELDPAQCKEGSVLLEKIEMH
ncbi:MAG TPA: glucosamine-6-phosphate deaminase [Paenalcaligenes sp.]|nr:glucosamine-6-phosphate deaminase [Paenalcaligenes sp.]